MNQPIFDPPFRDPALSTGERVDDLLGRLTLEEKLGLLHRHQAPVDRLGLRAFHTGTQALHGVALHGVVHSAPATVFPQAIGLASTWNPDLVRRVGDAVGEEVVAFHRKNPAVASRNVWAPVVNPLRDPRWGRNEEGYSEDPWLTGVMGTAYALGLGGDQQVLKTAPTLMYFLAYNNETDRRVSSSNVPPRVLREFELKAFRPAIETGAAVAVMPSYNLVNGRPAHLSPLIGELRTWADEDVFVVGAPGAVGDLTGPQSYYEEPPRAYAHAIRAGVDSFTEDDAALTLRHIKSALDLGLLAEGDIDRVVRHILSIRVRLGEFDPVVPYEKITEEVINCPEHQRLAREAARQSITLLKNDRLLPLDSPRKIAVIGPLADRLMEDGSSGTLPYQVTARTALAERCETLYCAGVDRVALRVMGGYLQEVPDGIGRPVRLGPEPSAFELFDWGGGTVAFRSAGHSGGQLGGQLGGTEARQMFRVEERPGGVALRHISSGGYLTVADGVAEITDDPAAAAVLTVETIESGPAMAAAVAAQADVAVVVLGDHAQADGGETEDRADLALPRRQEDLLRAVRAANRATVLILRSGYPFAVTWADEHVPAVIWSAHGGQEYGHALADVLFGDEDPGGRLTQTWYRSAVELPELSDYDVVATDATYMYYRGTPLYPFGHGLSYARFTYSDLTLSSTDLRPDETLTVSVTVTNTGWRPGEEVVQVYTHQQGSRVKQPLRQLRGFQKVTLGPGESRLVPVHIPVSDLAFWDVIRGRFVVEDATHKVQVGRSSRAIQLGASFTVRGETISPRDAFDRPVNAIDHDEYDGIVLCDAAPEAGDAVRSVEAGAWILFRQVDLGQGAVECVLTASGAGGTGALTVRLDDPLFGAVIGAFRVPPAATRHDFAEVRGPLAKATGVRDLYLVFENEGVTVRTLEFGRQPPQGRTGDSPGPITEATPVRRA